MRKGTMGASAAAAALVVGAAVMAVPTAAHAGGAIGWANAVNEFATEGALAGGAALFLGIVALGAILFFGITGLISTVIMGCLGGALMANSAQVATIFGGGAGGGSIYHTTLTGSQAAVSPMSPVVVVLTTLG